MVAVLVRDEDGVERGGVDPRGLEPLRKLLETRDKLRDLLTKVDRSDDLENVLERVLQNTDELKKLSTELGIGGDAAPSSDNS